MQNILTQLIKEKELPRALQRRSVSAEQGTYMGEKLRKTSLHRKRQRGIQTALLRSLASHPYDDFAAVVRQCFDNRFLSRLQLLRCGMFHQLMRTTLLCNSMEKQKTTN